MRSLFLKIFLSFWLAQALFLVLAVLVTLAIRQQAESAWDAEQTQVLTQAVQAYESGGQATLASYLDKVRQSEHVRAYLLNEKDEELSGRRLPEWAKDIEHRHPRPSHGDFLGWMMPARPQRQSLLLPADVATHWLCFHLHMDLLEIRAYMDSEFLSQFFLPVWSVICWQDI